MLTVSPTQLKDILIHTIKNRRSALIVGKPGIGKTDIIKQAAAETDSDVILDYPSVADPTDYKGYPFPDPDGKSAKFLMFGNLIKLIEATKSTVWYPDEIGQAPESVQKALMHPILARTINGYRMSEHVSIIAATNRREDKAGVTGLLETVKSRFDCILHLEPDIESWVKWALTAGMPVELIAHERFRPEFVNMNNWKPSPDMVNSPSPRTIAKVGQWMLTNPPAEMEYSLYAGAAGEAYAADLLAFLKVFRQLPSIDLILMNPDKEKIPKEPATLYAICAALTGKASQQTMPNIVKYLNRMDTEGGPSGKGCTEFSVMTIRDILTKDKSLTNTKSFIEWSVKHSNVLV